MFALQHRLKMIAAAVATLALVVLLVAARPHRPRPSLPRRPMPSHRVSRPHPAHGPRPHARAPRHRRRPGHFRRGMHDRFRRHHHRHRHMSSEMGGTGSSSGVAGGGGSGGDPGGGGGGGGGTAGGGAPWGVSPEAAGFEGDWEADAIVPPPVSPEETTADRLLRAAGVPLGGGRLAWPLGLRLLPAPDAIALRDRVEALLQVEADQAADGPVDAGVYLNLASALDELSNLLDRDREQRFSLPAHAYETAEKFLAEIRAAGKRLARGHEPAPRAVR